MESFVIFLRNNVLILNGKENKKASEICFEIRIWKKKNEELSQKVPSHLSNFLVFFWKIEKHKKGILKLFDLQLELKDYPLDLAWIVTFFSFSSKSKIGPKPAQNQPNFRFCFFYNHFSKIGSKMNNSCTYRKVASSRPVYYSIFD